MNRWIPRLILCVSCILSYLKLFTLDPDRCRPIAVGMLGRDLLLLLAMSLACEDVIADGPTNLANNPGPIDDAGGCVFPEA